MTEEHIHVHGLGIALNILTLVVEIILKLTCQSQNNMKECATVSDEMEGHKKKLISSSDTTVSLKKKKNTGRKSQCFFSVSKYCENLRKEVERANTQNTNF